LKTLPQQVSFFFSKAKLYKMATSETVNTQEKKENPRCFFDVTIGDKPGM
jgi:hypothetical protein